MRSKLLTAISFLAIANPALAQSEVPSGQAATPSSTGDPVLDRLNALEARVQQLEARNADLEQQLQQSKTQAVQTTPPVATKFGWVPAISDSSGDFTFKPRGVVEADGVAFIEREGGYDYNNGTALRRARLGVEGTAFKYLNYRLEVDFAGNAVTLTDAYLQYTKIPKTILTLGQHKAPFGLESNNSDNYNTFLERGMFTNAFGNVGAERRIGFSAAYAPQETINFAVGLFGDNESISRSSSAPVTDTPDESWGVNARATYEPLFEKGKIIHLGLGGYYRTALRSGDTEDAVRLSDRPNIRVDNGNIADSGTITDVRSLRYGGAEAAAVFGPLTLAGEVGKLWLDRPDEENQSFTGFYVYGSYFLTGETRPFKSGNFDRVKPKTQLGKDGLGAFELAVRYDWLDLSETPVMARSGNEARSFTLGLNWYFNPYAKLMFNWVRFSGDNTPLDPIGTETEGDALATRFHFDF